MKDRIMPIALAAMLAACNSQTSVDDEKQQNLLVEDRQQVKIEVARTMRFDKEIVSNGKIVAGRYADVYWEVDGTISDVYTSNGRYIQKGADIARLDSYKLALSFESAEASLERSRLSMYETLIGQGYSPDSTNIPESIRHLAEVKSGFLESQANYNTVKYDYEHSRLTAPISGVVANLTDKPSNRVNRGSAFCRIIDQSALCAEFTIIETELSMVSVGSDVEITTYSAPGKSWRGRVTEVNPYVENNGMVRVKASVEKCTDLYEGMNISVKIRRDVGERLSVPKSAVVLRSNRQVVFVARNGLAEWCYVETSLENSNMIAIESGINEGDSVVVSGNSFLAHNSEIIY
ncbi:MAG: efflux RND transporter periplasmic adaptor subunit [Bacteroidales bacterium]|nr:efflux RND transporter periplasmic adaptor subunit [Bacteroidales bacterium]